MHDIVETRRRIIAILRAGGCSEGQYALRCLAPTRLAPTRAPAGKIMSNITASASGPLLGVKILDLTQYQVRRPHPHPLPPVSADSSPWWCVQNGPTATMMMADFGADVVKVERPEGGDPGRGGHMADGKAPRCLLHPTPPNPCVLRSQASTRTSRRSTGASAR